MENQEVNNCNLFVGNFPRSWRDEDLKAVFVEFGEIKSAMVIMDKLSGRSKGIGFVEFVNEADAMRAKDELSGKEFDDGRGNMRPLNIDIARPRAPRTEGSFRPRSDDRQGGGYRSDRGQRSY